MKNEYNTLNGKLKSEETARETEMYMEGCSVDSLVHNENITSAKKFY
jgi:hypothetical protein